MDRLLCQAAALRAVRRTAAEELTARLSQGVVVKPEYLLERSVPGDERADTIRHAYPVWEMLEHLGRHIEVVAVWGCASP